MKIENQCCNLIQAKRLNELGIIQGKSFFFYDTWKSDKNSLSYNLGNAEPGYLDAKSCFSAFTVAELGVMLPEGYTMSETTNFDEPYRKWICGKVFCDGDDVDYEKCGYGSTEAEARAAMLIYFLESNLITASEVNKRLEE